MRGGKTKTQERGAVAHRRARKGSAGASGHKGAGKAPAAAGGGGRREFPVFESIGQAAAVLGAPVALLKAAKRKGCKAFISGSRVDAGVLLPFLFSMTQKNGLPEGMASAADWLMTEKARREAIRRKTDERSMMPIALACRQATEACGFFFSELERAERELPPALASGTAVEIYKRLHAFTEALRKSAKARFERIGK